MDVGLHGTIHETFNFIFVHRISVNERNHGWTYVFDLGIKRSNLNSNHHRRGTGVVTDRRELLIIIDNQDNNGRVTSQLSHRLAAGALRRV